MYFWRIEKLKRDIERGQFGSKEVIPYIVISLALYTIGVEVYRYLPFEEPSKWTYLDSVATVLITIAGTIYTYRANGGAEGNQFATKFFSIGFVIGVRFVAYLIPIMGILFAYCSYKYDDHDLITVDFFEVTLLAAWHIMLYLRIAKHMRDTATTTLADT